MNLNDGICINKYYLSTVANQTLLRIWQKYKLESWIFARRYRYNSLDATKYLRPVIDFQPSQ